MRRGTIDYTLMIVTIVLVAMGLLMVFSASYYMAQSSAVYDYDGLSLFKKQLVGAAVGLGLMIVFSLFDYKLLIKLKYPLLIATVALLIIVFIPGLGVELNGSSRWIRFGSMPSIQPSEFAKFTLIIFIAATIYVNRNRMDTFRFGILPNLLVLGLVCILLILQPNFSAVLLLAILAFVMMFVGGAKGWQLALLGVGGGIGMFFMMLGESYRVGRVSSFSFTDPWQYAADGNYQVVQSLYGIGAGGVLGRGLGNGRQKFLWLPFGESDFIFSITAEELGLVGAVLMILLFIVLAYRGIRIAQSAPDLFGTLLATGVTTIISIQVIINIGVVTSSIPATGVSLPFISYGNTSLMIFMAMIGILLNISKQSRRPQKRQKSARNTTEGETGTT